MARDNELIITAGLNTDQTTEDISKDLKQVSDKLNASRALKIVCNINISKTITRIQSQLNTISKDFSIKIGNIDLNTSTSNAVKNFDAISDSAEKANEKIAETKKRLADLDSKFTKPIKIVELADVEAIISKLKNQLSSLGTVTVTGKYINKTDGDDKSTESLNGLTATVKAVNGEVRTLNFLLDDTGTKFKYIGGSFSDKGIYQALAKATTEADKLSRQINNLKASADDTAASRPIMSEEGISKVAEAYKQAKTAIEAFRNANEGTYAELENNAKAAVDNLNNIIKSQRNLETAASKLRAQKIEVITGQEMTKLDKLEAMISGSMLSDVSSLISKVNDLRTQLSNVGNDKSALIEYQDSLSRFEAELQTLKVQAQATSKAISLDNKIARASAALDAYANANKKAISSTKLMSDGVTTFAEKWDELTSRMNSGNLSADEFKHLNEELATFKQEVKAAGLDSGAFFRKMGDQIRLVVTQWISLNAVIGKTRDMVNKVIDIDNAMVNLKKVTDETDSTYEKFLDKADVRARNLHTTISDLTAQTSEWAKLGFDLEKASKLAETSMIYSKVGEVDNQTAVSTLVATMKAFNMEAKEAMVIVDSLNKLGNEFSTDAGALGDGLSVSASTLATAGNDLSQSLALLTGGTEITQDANAMGNALRTISLRIRGMKGELEALNEETDGIESISKIQTQILNLTGNKVNIFDSGNNFRSTYDILKDISEVYNDLSDPSRADLTEILFGKNRANQGIAILQAFQSGQIEKAYEAAENSFGSATAEYDKMSEGIEAHINDLHEAWEKLSNDFINSDLLKTAIDFGTKLIDILDALIKKVGAFPALTGAIAGGLSFKGVGRPKTEYA